MISFFARPYFIAEELAQDGPCFYLRRGSSLIRGEQIAEFIGGKYNPTEGYENDICIYIKPKTLDKIKDGDYVDVSDGEFNIMEQLVSRPNIKIIATTDATYDFMKKRLKNPMTLIHEQHCNFERAKISRSDITTAGFLGTPGSFTYSVADMTERLGKIGIKFIASFNWKNRQDVVDFYKKIDIQIIGYTGGNDPFRHPNKLINAMAFGVPSVSNPQVGFQEIEGNYIIAPTVDMIVEQVKKLKNKDYYEAWSRKVLEFAEGYHIENIAKLYKQLT